MSSFLAVLLCMRAFALHGALMSEDDQAYEVAVHASLIHEHSSSQDQAQAEELSLVVQSGSNGREATWSESLGGRAPVDCSHEHPLPQSPRDVGDNSHNNPDLVFSVANFDDRYVHVNTHFHLGAEHFQSEEYDIPAEDLEGAPIPGDQNPGFFCRGSIASREKADAIPVPVCKDVFVGETYEFHWVYSTAGVEIGPGLGGAFAKSDDPDVIVKAQVFVVIAGDDDGSYDMLYQGPRPGSNSEFVGYVGSTTGPKYNGMCSPIAPVSWHVDRKCQEVTAGTLAVMCEKMNAAGLGPDAQPHGSRSLVDAEYTTGLVKL